jgi:hypothetical protein
VVGLLDGLVVRELELQRHGYRVLMADPNLWCPLPDGRSLAVFCDRDRTAEHMRASRFNEADVSGMVAYEEMFGRLRRLLRRGPRGDTWSGSSPSREELEEALGHDEELISVVFSESIARLSNALDDARPTQIQCDRRLRGSSRPRHRLGETDAPPGGPARARIVLGICRRRHGPGFVCDRPSGAGERRHSRHRSPRGEDCPRGGGRDRKRRVDPCPHRSLQRGPEANPGDARGGCRADALSPADRRLADGLAGGPAERRLHKLPAFTAPGGVDTHRAMVSITAGSTPLRRPVEACRRGEPRSASPSSTSRAPTTPRWRRRAPHDERLRPIRAL